MHTMTIEEIRKLHINYLSDKYGRNKLAEMLGHDGTNYLNGLCAGGSFGSPAARKIEKSLGLPVGEIDEFRPYLAESGSVRLTKELLEKMDKISDEQLAVVSAMIDQLLN